MVFVEHKVWDRSQRIFHWINALAVLTLIGVGIVILNADALGVPDDPGMVLLKTTHVYAGYVFVINLAWRLLWGFIGGPFARWRALLPCGPGFRRQLVEFVRGFVSGHPPTYLGHNPVARIFLSMLLIVLLVQGATGLILAGTDVYMPPFGGMFAEWVAADTHDAELVRPYTPETVNADAYASMRAFRSPIVAIHEYGFFILLAMIAIHVAAAVIVEVREGGHDRFRDVHRPEDPSPHSGGFGDRARAVTTSGT